MNGSILRFSLISVIFVLLTSCSGGESGTGISDSDVSVGVITGFGSVYVSGVEYNTSTAQIHVNESAATEQDLSIGMVVTVVGKHSQGTAKADAIYYESEICGIVDQNNQDGTLAIMGQMVKYDSETVFYSEDNTITVIEDIPAGAVVEVSGYRTADNALYATQLVLVGAAYTTGEELTVKGVITTGLSNGTFAMGGLTIAVDDSSLIDLPNQQLTPGTEIKVKSRRGVRNNELQADTIKSGARNYATVGGTVGIEGIVMNLNPDSAEFKLHGYTINFSNQTEYTGGTASDLAEGVKAEVGGVLLSDNLVEAKKIIFRKTARLELIAPVTSIDTAQDQVDMSGVMVQLTNRTLIKDDDRTTKIRGFSLLDTNIGDRIKIKAYQDNLSGEIVATQFRRVEALSADTSFELSGVLDELNANQAIISGVYVDISQITSSELTMDDVGTNVSVTGVTPLTL